MSDNNVEYTVSSALTRTMRFKLILLCAAGFLLFLSAFQFLSRQYLHHIEDQAEKKFYISRAKNFRSHVDSFLDIYGFTEIEQLSLQTRNYNKLYFTRSGDVLYAVLSDLNGFVILHSDNSQEGSRINIPNDKDIFSGYVVKNSDIKIKGNVQKVCDVTLPVVLSGTTQGVLRIGYARTGLRPIHDTEITARAAIRYAYIVLLVFIVLSIVLIWCVSFFLERHAGKISREQQKKNRQQLEIIGAGIVHEVKNSLNGIRMNIQMLQDKFEKLPPELKESFSKNAERIQREAGHTSDMLSEFLTYAKPGKFNPAPTNIPALLNEIAQSFESECKKRNIKFICECSSEMTSITADSRQLRHGVTNLLWNSLEAVDKDGKIILKGEFSGHKAKISVEDDGGGMDTETEGKSFEVFYSTKAQGSGLGLSIVKKVALSHGGKVITDNHPGKGCKFTIIFPVTDHE